MNIRDKTDMNVAVVLKDKPRGYRVVMVRWIDKDNRAYREQYKCTRDQIVQAVRNNKIKILNATIQKDNRIYIRKYENKINYIKNIAIQLRRIFEATYGTGTDLCGYCIQASEMLAEIFTSMGLECYTVEGWCEFDDEYYGSDRPYDPHTWLEIRTNRRKPIYVDITADQFNPGIYAENEFSGVIINEGLPHGMSYSEPVIYE